jgi:hypothetical protein
MQKQIAKWNTKGDDIVRIYDDETADLEEVDQYIHDLEKTMGVRAFDSVTGEVIEKLTRENSNVDLVPQMAGG